MAFVAVSIGGEEISRHALRGATVIGRSVDADVSIRDASMSRWHCRIEPAGDPATVWTVTDLGSRNGTNLNGRRVTKHVLREGDLLRIGRVTMYFSEGELLAGEGGGAGASGAASSGAGAGRGGAVAEGSGEVAEGSGESAASVQRPASPMSVPRRATGFSRPLFVPSDRLARPVPDAGPVDARSGQAAALAGRGGFRSGLAEDDIMSSPGWSRNLGKSLPAPGVSRPSPDSGSHDSLGTLDLNAPPGQAELNGGSWRRRVVAFFRAMFRR